MTPRPMLRTALTLLALFVSSSSLAAGRDGATLKKIDEALNVHYLAANYEKAEKVLETAIKACGAKFCSGEVLAKAHVAVGVVRGNAKQDLAGARAAFENAKAADPNVTLDANLVTPTVLAEFYKVMGREVPPEIARAKAAESGDPLPPDTKESAAPRVSPAGNLRCTPVSGYEIQTAQPIAVVCEPLEGVVRAELYYRTAGEQDYTAILMSVQDGTLRANIPCEPLTKAGKLDVYILAQDFNKETIDTFGTRVKPAHYRIVEKTTKPVPSYPGQSAPKRCEELLIGGASEGAACSATEPCKFGLYCAEGTCRPAPTCETDSECDSKQCSKGYCAMDEETADVEESPSRWMIGLHGGLDIWLAPSGTQVCGSASLTSGDYSCYNRGENVIYVNTPAKTNVLPMTDPGAGGNVDAGVRLATFRALLSVDYVLMKYLSVGTRLGWAFGGGPRAIKYTNGQPDQTKQFLPIHAEARGTLWLRSLGKKGLHPYVHLSAGVAQVDAKIPINARLNGASRQLDAWKKMGMGFVGGGFGALYTFHRHFGVQLNVNGMFMLPSTGLVLEPSLGGVVAF